MALLGPRSLASPCQPSSWWSAPLLLMFGLRWLRKTILRAAGVLALHDEAQAFAQEAESLRRAGEKSKSAIDKVAFGTSFKIVMLEGIEVVFIVIAIGAGGPLIVPASIGARLALLAVSVVGLVEHRPLVSVPENTLKFVVGVLLAAFGTFWVSEGIELTWPGADWAIFGLVVLYLVVVLPLVALCRRLHVLRAERARTLVPSTETRVTGALGVIARELWSLFVADGWLTARVLMLVGAMWLTRTGTAISTTWLCLP